MADPLSGIAIIICIAFGVLTFVLLFIFANRQIKRFSIKSKSGPHMPIAQDVPKCVLTEINRRLDIVKEVAYHPVLLKESDQVFFNENIDNDAPVHLYRMKALDSVDRLDAAILATDPTRCRLFSQEYRVFLIRLFQNGVLGQIEIYTIHRYSDLYELARHEPGEFKEEHYIEFMDLMAQILQSISTRSCSRAVTKTQPSRSLTNGKVPAVPSCLPTSPEDPKATYETSV